MTHSGLNCCRPSKHSRGGILIGVSANSSRMLRVGLTKKYGMSRTSSYSPPRNPTSDKTRPTKQACLLQRTRAHCRSSSVQKPEQVAAGHLIRIDVSCRSASYGNPGRCKHDDRPIPRTHRRQEVLDRDMVSEVATIHHDIHCGRQYRLDLVDRPADRF